MIFCVLSPYSRQLEDVCIQNGDCMVIQPFPKIILLTALFEGAHSSQNALASWLRTHGVRHRVEISACVDVHEAFTVHPVGSARRGFVTPQRQRRTFPLKNTVSIHCCTFKVDPSPPPPPSPYLLVHWIPGGKKTLKDSSGTLWKSLIDLMRSDQI